MPRTARHAPKGFTYHVLNRAVARLPLFYEDADYDAFEQVLEEAHERFPLDIFAYCLMPNHWHFVLRPNHDGRLTEFLRWLTHTHTMRWHAHFHSSGSGHLYQGCFKAFPVEDDEHFYTVTQYVERNALPAKLVRKAENWRWSSLARRERGDAEARSLFLRPGGVSRWSHSRESAPPRPRPSKTQGVALDVSAERGTRFELSSVVHA